ncbi:MAG TPA: LysR substrate-binding domain-containing protein [Acetobacteraceae bacterium]|nr:LysR substrate-binding domain-containing protein [Acetobacteraceae bacterium]
MLDLRQLRQFVAVAEAEHVGRAAEALNMSQSPLSRQVMQLEAILGLRLFERARKRVRLTREGRAFLTEARVLLAQAERVEALGRRMGRGEAGALTLGYVEGAVHAGLLPRAMRRFRVPRPEIRIELRALRSAPQFEALRRREIDCGLLYTPPDDDDPDLAGLRLMEEPMLLAVPADHPLAGKQSVMPADLDGQPWVSRPRALNPGAEDRFLSACAACGFTPDLRFEAGDPATSLGLVAAGLGLALVQASMRTIIRSPDVVLVDLPWYPLTVRLHAAWRRADASCLVTEWLRALRDA